MIIEIGGQPVGDRHPTFVVAELSANHNGKFDLALETIKAAKDSGADAIKVQTYTADTITIDSDNEWFRVKKSKLWDGRTLYDLYKEAYTPWEWQPKLKEYANSLGLIFFSSPFDYSAVDFLSALDMPAYKIASYEITDIPLIEYVAAKGKPVIISTGIATLADIEEAVQACKKVGNDQILLLKCTSSYPAPIEEANLRTIENLRETFKCIPGLSDHTMGDTVAIASVALGAKMVEKHFILDRGIGGPDSAFSMEPAEFKHMVGSIRKVEAALGSVKYDLSDDIQNSRLYARSLFVVKDIEAGEILTNDNIRSIRPGQGLHPRFLHEVIGKKAAHKLTKGTPLAWEHISNPRG